ncbi:MAG: hypothetical protein CL424_13970 [Acidimicrobiaceae bacterium]|nr:hypothetical protein [Acidimicrobiaceae bacterium]
MTVSRKALPVAGAAALATAVAIAAVAAVAASKSVDAKPVTNRINRTTRIWRLSIRNSARFAVAKVRGIGSADERRAAIDEEFAIRTAEDVARELGQMKGVLMKAGQMISFIFESLPEDAQAALATLQADGEPMSPTLAAQVVAEDLGGSPEHVFLDWTDRPVAAASIGQVHRAVTHDGRDVAVKVQYPGVHEAIEHDLDAAEVMYGMFSSMMLKGLDAKGLVDELRMRMREELDYRLEAQNLLTFTEVFANHPWARIPTLVPECSTGRVLTTEWVDGMSFEQFMRDASRDTKQRAGEVLWRFAQHAVNRHGIFNGDPHPGNYKFHHDGSVTFLDFGLVKRWQPGEWESLRPTLDAVIIDRDPELVVAAMEESGFLRRGHGIDPQVVFDYVSSPYRPYLVDEFRFSREWMIETLGRVIDVKGPHAKVIEALNMPASFVILDRVVWGVNAILGKLEVEGPFRAMLLEYVAGGPPATEIGAAEAAWMRAGASS